jgi:translation initiation factor IF-2
MILWGQPFGNEDGMADKMNPAAADKNPTDVEKKKPTNITGNAGAKAKTAAPSSKPTAPTTGSNAPRPNLSRPNAPRPNAPRPNAPRPSGTGSNAPRPSGPGNRPNAPRPGGNGGGSARPSQPPRNGQRPANLQNRPHPGHRPSGGHRPPQGPRPAQGSAQGPRPTQKPAAPVAPPKPVAPQVVTLPASLTVRDLATLLKLTPIEIIKKLMANGVMANITQSIDFDTAALIAEELGFQVREEKPEVVEEVVSTLSSMPKKQQYSAEELKNLQPRPPVVTVMGHVDHGKTSLLDAIRHTNVVAGEFGGITQHIGAYQIMHNGKKITFLDTPGHEAFTAMRARGAKATDIAIIVVAADDGVMPTTREAIEHARAAQVPIIVALNKIDRPNANPERVKQQLSEIGLEVYGGKDEVTVVPISAKQKIGLEDLLENILLVAELADLKANPERPAHGVVIESRLDKQQGPTATLLVQEGTLNVGDIIVMGETFGKVRAMFNERGETVAEATPATPVVVTGLSDVPPAGETFEEVESEHIARARAEERIQARRAKETKSQAISLNELYSKFKEGSVKELNLLIKADVAGSLEPIVSSLEKLGTENLHVKILRQGIGTVTQADVMLAAASQGIIIAFNVSVESAAEALADQEHVDIRKYNIIYKLIEDIDKALKGMLEPEYKDVFTGRAQVLKIFNIKRNVIAGCRVIKGTVMRGTTAKVIRGAKEIFSGPLSSLKRFTDDVKEVAEGYECGIGLEGFNDLQEGDVIEFYKKERVS